jgi:type II secretory pathway component GspD/PulD (secretin)
MIRQFPLLLAGLLAMVCASSAEDETIGTGLMSFNSARDSVVLDIYSKLTGLELAIDPRVKVFEHPVTFRNTEPLTKTEAVQMIEKALLTQAGIVITRLDDKRATVKYNDALPTTIDFNSASVNELFNNYQQLTGLDLVLDSRAGITRHWITIHSAGPLPKDEAIKLLEKTLLTQANVVITRLDDKRASATYTGASLTHTNQQPVLPKFKNTP